MYSLISGRQPLSLLLLYPSLCYSLWERHRRKREIMLLLLKRLSRSHMPLFSSSPIGRNLVIGLHLAAKKGSVIFASALWWVVGEGDTLCQDIFLA